MYVPLLQVYLFSETVEDTDAVTTDH